VHGCAFLNVTSSPILTNFQLSSSHAAGPFTTKFGRNCNGPTGFSRRPFKSSNELKFINM
jgi:hypothetical protein